MTKPEETIIQQTEQYVRSTLQGDSTGHDWFHVDRVRNLALYIAQNEKNANVFIVELAALLHDIADWKFHGGSEDIGPKTAGKWLTSLNIPTGIISEVCNIIKGVSFKGAGAEIIPLSLEGQIIQDADRLDAMGAIGIARAFAYGGYKGREIYNPENDPLSYASFEEYKSNQSSTINHFYEKLLLLKDRMNTKTAKLLAEKRHQRMLNFLNDFKSEWGF